MAIARLRIWAVTLACLSAACASTGSVPRPFPTPGSPGPRAEASTSAAGEVLNRSALVQTALDLLGTRYRNGGSDPTGFDCSGFTQYVFARHGLALPRQARDQFGTGHSIESRTLAPGDLLFFSTVAPGPSHVAISIGGDRFVHAPSSNGVVRVERLSSSYWSPRFIGARRIPRATSGL